MVQPTQQKTAKDERRLATKAFREMKGVFTQSDRSAMPPDFFYNLENFQPIGPSNLHMVPNISASLHDYATDQIYYAQFGQVGSTPYLFSFASNGKIFAWNFNASTNTELNSALLLSGTGSRMTQWENQYVLFIDSTGYYKWDGTTFAQITGSGIPTSGVDISVYAGRVWIANGRLVSISAAYDGTSTTDPTGVDAWSATYGADFLNMTDPTLVGNITRLWQTVGYLFIFGETCLYSVSNVYVPAGASPPTPVFTLLPVQGVIGTDQTASVFPFNTSLMFANRYGGWVTDGVNCERFSEAIDGTWQYLSFSPSISGGYCIVNNILCSAFLLKRANDPDFGSDTVLGMWFNGKWWFANFGAISFITTAIINAVPTLCAFLGNKLYTLFTNTASFPTGVAQTPLWDMDDPLSDKEVIRAGFQTVIANGEGSISSTVDGLEGEVPFQESINSTLIFVGSNGQPVTFVGSNSLPITWTNFGTYVLFSGDPPGTFSKNVGMTITTTNINLQLVGVYMDTKVGQRWKFN
jgi:hypothetical protein